MFTLAIFPQSRVLGRRPDGSAVGARSDRGLLYKAEVGQRLKAGEEKALPKIND